MTAGSITSPDSALVAEHLVHQEALHGSHRHLMGGSAEHRSLSEQPRVKPEVSSDDDQDHDLDWVVWTPDDVGDWVDMLCGDQLGAAFRQNKVDGPTLLELTDDDLRTLLGVANPIQRSKILGHVHVFQMRRTRLVQPPSRRRVARGPPRPSYHPRDVSQATNGMGFHPLPRRGVPKGRSAPSSMSAMAPPTQSLSHAQLSRAPTEASSAGGSSRCDDERSGFSSTSNRWSKYTNPNKVCTSGLSSFFGLDSPSYSLRGSFSLAPKRLEPDSFGPGPTSYSHTTVEAYKPMSPRCVIGTSGRNTGEHFVSAGTGKFSTATTPARVKGGVIGTSPRWGQQNGRPGGTTPSCSRTSPGPSNYNPSHAFLSTFK